MQSIVSPTRKRGLLAFPEHAAQASVRLNPRLRVGLTAGSLALLALASTAQAAPPSFRKDVQPFLVKYCVECHGDKKPKKGLNFSSYENLMRGAKKKPVIPGKPRDSLLILTMESRGKKKMPPPKYKNQPTAKEIAVIRAWVQAGAKDDTARGAGTAYENRLSE